MRLLVTGASGFVGSRLVEVAVEALGAGQVTAVIGPFEHDIQRRRTERLRELGVAVVDSDLRRSPVLHGPVPEFDVLVHLAAYVTTEVDSPDVAINDEGTRRLLGELGERLRGKRVVYASTLAAVEAPASVRGGVDQPLRPGLPATPRTPYGRTKLRAEGIVRESSARLGHQHTILQLCTVYGPGYRAGGMFDMVPAMLRRGSPAARVAWPGRMSIVHVDDLARILYACAGEPRVADRTFLVSTGEDPSMAQIIERVAEIVSLPYAPVPVPGIALAAARTALGAGLWSRMPYAVFIAAWRASLLVEGLFCDGSELTELLGMKYVPWREAIGGLYTDRAR